METKNKYFSLCRHFCALICLQKVASVLLFTYNMSPEADTRFHLSAEIS